MQRMLERGLAVERIALTMLPDRISMWVPDVCQLRATSKAWLMDEILANVRARINLIDTTARRLHDTRLTTLATIFAAASVATLLLMTVEFLLNDPAVTAALSGPVPASLRIYIKSVAYMCLLLVIVYFVPFGGKLAIRWHTRITQWLRKIRVH